MSEVSTFQTHSRQSFFKPGTGESEAFTFQTATIRNEYLLSNIAWSCFCIVMIKRNRDSIREEGESINSGPSDGKHSVVYPSKYGLNEAEIPSKSSFILKRKITQRKK